MTTKIGDKFVLAVITVTVVVSIDVSRKDI